MVTTDLGVGDIGFVASSTLLAAGGEGFEDNSFAGDPLLLLSSSTLLAIGEGILRRLILRVIHFYSYHLQQLGKMTYSLPEH